MSLAAKTFLSSILMAAFLPSSFAQQSAGSPPGTRSVVVNVLDAHGDAIRDLTRENFRVRVNGKPIAVIDARYSLAPRKIVILLDMSGSMNEEKGSQKWRIAREAVDDLLAQIPGEVPVAMLTFAGKINDVFDFPASRTAIAKWLKEDASRWPKLNEVTRTALFDAILEGLKLMGTAQPGDALYAITDGADNASQVSAVQAKAALLQSGVRLFAFLFSEPLLLPSEQDRKESFLRIVDDSGGSVFEMASYERRFAGSSYSDYAYDEGIRKKVSAYTKELNTQLNAFWTLELAMPSSEKDRKVKLEVIGSEARKRKNIKVTYPRVLPATGVATVEKGKDRGGD